MYWKEKYEKAINENKQLICDNVMREAFYKQFKDVVTVEEVRFPEFQADLLEFRTIEGELKLIGYEFKSDRDTLDRLENQLRGYLKYCNYVFVYSTLRHKKELLQILNKPEFGSVGVRFYKMTNEGNIFAPFRTAKVQNVKNKGLSTDWISKKYKLFRWIYLLKEVWGEDI